jgi:murein DD-endopeptidase MepM/ murein hydrolase activator NlpD
VQNPALRRVTQGWAARPEYYSQFAVDGVALKGHNGIDFGTTIGSIIVAVDAGRVVEVADESPKGFGKYVKLVHRWGESLYAHLSEQHVQVGETVGKGEIIAKSGNSGNSSGPHLHYGMRVSPFNRRDGWGGYSDPAKYLSNTTQPTSPQPQPTGDLLPLIKAAAKEFGIDWQLLASLSWAESSFDPGATSTASAMGLCQIAPATWVEWSANIGAGNDPYNPKQNLRVGAAYIAWCIKQTGHTRRGLWAYVWGAGNVQRAMKNERLYPPEVIEYANKILHGRDLLKAVTS